MSLQPPCPPDPINTAIVDAAAGAFDNTSMPLLNVLQEARDRRRAARLAISARDLVTVTVSGAGCLASAAQWLGVEEHVLVDRIASLSSGEWSFVWTALLAVAG